MNCDGLVDRPNRWNWFIKPWFGSRNSFNLSKNPPLTAVRLWLDEIFTTKIKEILSNLISDDCVPISKLEKRLKVGRTRFRKSKIGMVPCEGYVKRDNYNKTSIQWLEWLMVKSKRTGQPVHIRHALNGGEYRIAGTNYRADGYDVKTKTVPRVRISRL